ncbi:glycoside hydrolase family 43 protein [Armillaria solidipes]|uniref:Glycoside hydrolase family 43 protein n=1 Tax=Armillaria solidipes TaxID=1076256 RepID=A0A2H3AKN6_9AGAR|nr:glycoside hydrolase family 43 protein [Armillaria solidipes]
MPCIFSLLGIAFGIEVALVHALINPILPGFNPDPSVLSVGSNYFIATSTFEYFPGVPIYHSTNLVDWELIGHGLTRPLQLSLLGTPSDAGVWAPTLRFHGGVYYLVCTTRYVYTPEFRLFPRSFYVSTEDIFVGEWSDPVYFDFLGYDADLFWDTNGDVYATWTGISNAVDKIYGIYQSKIDLVTGDSLTCDKLIFNGTLPNDSTSRPEGPHVYLVNGTYYLMIAEGGTGIHHQATIQRGPSPSGPWENNPSNPIVYNGANLSLPVQSTGHADFMQAADGSWWGTCLGTVPQNGNFSYQQLGRQTFLFPVTWEDGWPVFNGGRPLSLHMDGVLEDKSPLSSYSNGFTSATLDNSFYFVRNPYKAFHSLTDRPGYLRLKANGYALGDRDSAAIITRKQTAYEETFETILEFSPATNLTEAGLSVFYGDMMHNDIGITGESGKRYIVTRTLVPAEQEGPWGLTFSNNTITTTNYYELESTDQPVRLRVIAKSTEYTLGYAEGRGGPFNDLTTFSSVYMTVPPTGGFFFKGASFALYNTGQGRSSSAFADFGYWKQILSN